MRLTPNQAFGHISESVVEYLETAYKIAHSAVFAERGVLLRQPGTITQTPFIEATPAFPSGVKLADLERQRSDIIPAGLHELVQHGVAVDKFPLYTHQEDSLQKAFSERPNLLVATGTGSGKTESFLLPILTDILREAESWTAPSGPARPGSYDEQTRIWQSSRRHETRPAALRAIVLYPMNALVNDQLSRLRRILANGASPQWQRQRLKGNQIYFGMYTGLAQPTGSYHNPIKRHSFEEYYKGLEEDWASLDKDPRKSQGKDLQMSGSWPRPGSPEMLCRWDIQATPPDILVTNYSMLEYMLVRPIEYNIFERTRQWLASTPDAHFTLVLDEAHTYTGAKGTEVAYLIRRLKERLGLATGSRQFRAIATTASVPADADATLKNFTADLFAEDAGRFSLIRAGESQEEPAVPTPTLVSLAAFATFQQNFRLDEPRPAIERLASDLGLSVSTSLAAPVVLHSLMEQNNAVRWMRQRTARRATPLDRLSQEYWGEVGRPEEQEAATAGVLAAGSFARPTDSPNIPPLLSMRIHAFTRGLPGLWACLNPACPEVPDAFKTADLPRPIGRLYAEPRAWCSPACGARVLELFSCRKCGLLMVGGIPGGQGDSLWPWSDQLDGTKQDLSNYRIFGVESPHPTMPPTHRSTHTTLECQAGDSFARPVYEVEAAKEWGTDKVISPYPERCPRCYSSRMKGTDGREVIEPLRTKGPRAFSVVAEDGFRVQAATNKDEPPNYGRKALLFSDSRMDAAQLAADLRRDHQTDLFRQLIYRVLHSCPNCGGTGHVSQPGPYRIGQPPQTIETDCQECNATGLATTPQPLDFATLRGRVIELQGQHYIDPTNGEIPNFYELVEAGDPNWSNYAETAFNVALRRELAETEFALEPLGLACWRVRLPETSFGSFEGLTELQTRLFLQLVTRILASEDILLPPNPHKPWEWPHDLVKEYDRNVLIWAESLKGNNVPYNLGPYRKLGRYVRAVASALVATGRIKNQEIWLTNLRRLLWDTLKELHILVGAGAAVKDQTPRGIRIDAFELQPVGSTVEQCQACALVMSESLFNICIRCGQLTRSGAVEDLRPNFYRRSARHALPGQPFNDPHPLRAIEHSAQINQKEARNYERWFQDMFHHDQNPYDKRIDVLSVTTTMEMGIDIGSLLSVGLRNVPPSVANYQQRAGRAGRRGSAIATIMTFAQFRSHDQYYFDRPPEIVSGAPRVPFLYLNNEVIAHRHVRSVILQSFFYEKYRNATTSNLFDAWGKMSDFQRQDTALALAAFLTEQAATLQERCAAILHSDFVPRLDEWFAALVSEVEAVVTNSEEGSGLLEWLIGGGLLPKYAFPVDVVRLNVPNEPDDLDDRRFETSNDNAMQRDLKIALAEYVPGAEVVRGRFPNTYIYKSAGLYDAYNREPNYRPQQQLVECDSCKSVQLIALDEPVPQECSQCGSYDLLTFPYLRPPGFTVDMALPNSGEELYESGGRERSGTVVPARLLLGSDVFSCGQPLESVAPHLYYAVRNDELVCCNKGPGEHGFLICPNCGRYFENDDVTGPHRYPADIPPNVGYQRGPRKGTRCPNTTNFDNHLVLGYKFRSDLILLSVDLPPQLEAPFEQNKPTGKAIWYSFGTLLTNAAALVLQVDTGELKVGVRTIRRNGQLQGEVFIYDDVPGGAGYARAIAGNLEAILHKALELGQSCANPDCSGACYHCMYDYRNQMLHPLLDRELGTAVLEYLLHGTLPQTNRLKVAQHLSGLEQYLQVGWTRRPGQTVEGVELAAILESRTRRIGLWVIHPLQAEPTDAKRKQIRKNHEISVSWCTSFDLERRPFWVSANL